MGTPDRGGSCSIHLTFDIFSMEMAQTFSVTIRIRVSTAIINIKKNLINISWGFHWGTKRSFFDPPYPKNTTQLCYSL
jgi:hypothetical protein